MPDFIKIGHTIAEIRRFNRFFFQMASCLPKIKIDFIKIGHTIAEIRRFNGFFPNGVLLTQYFTPWGINLQMPWVWVNQATTHLAVANGSEDHCSSQR